MIGSIRTRGLRRAYWVLHSVLLPEIVNVPIAGLAPAVPVAGAMGMLLNVMSMHATVPPAT